MFRRQLPAYSPLTAAGILSGLRSAGSRPRERLEQLVAERYAAEHVVLTGSGTQALMLALRASAPDDRHPPLVALPAYACYDVVSAAVGADARIVFYDVEPATLSPELGSLADVCALKPDAVVVAPLYGIPVDMERVRAATDACGALLVEDAAQGLGATWRGRPLGSLGDVSVLSFGRGKGWTGGVGGALLERIPEGRMVLPSGRAFSDLSVTARVIAQWLLGRPGTYWLPASLPWLTLGETEYHAPRKPEAMPELAAALLLAHEREATQECEARRRNAVEMLEALAASEALGLVEPVRVPEEGGAGYLRLPLLAPRGMANLGDIRSARSRGVMPGYPRPLPELPAARERILARLPATPGASQLAREVLTLPTHSLLTQHDKARTLKALEGLTARARPARRAHRDRKK